MKSVENGFDDDGGGVGIECISVGKIIDCYYGLMVVE